MGGSLASLGLCVLASVLGVLVALRARSERRRRVAAALALVVVGLTLMGHLALITAERDHVIRAVLAGESEVSTIETAWLLSVVVILGVALPLAMVATTRVLPQAHRGLGHAAAATVCLVGAVAASLLVALDVIVASDAVGPVMDDVSAWLDVARWTPVIVATVAGAVLAVRRLRSSDGRPPPGRTCASPALLLGLASLGLGVVAFVHTRAHAADRAARPSLRSDPIPEGVSLEVLPGRRSPSRPFEIAPPSNPPSGRYPLIGADGDGRFSLDGIEGDERAIGRLLMLRRRRWARRHPRAPFPGRVLVAAPAAASISALAPVLRQAFTAGYPVVGILLAERLPVRTRTLGTIERRRLYVIDFRMRDVDAHLDHAPRALPSTWGALVRDIDPRADGYLVP